MTPKMRELLTYIEAYIEDNDGVAPSFTQMMEAIDCASKSRIFDLIDCLEERGYIQRLPRKARSITILKTYQPPRNDIWDFIKSRGLEKQCWDYVHARALPETRKSA